MTDISTLDPERLEAFCNELLAAGFTRKDERTFEGPAPACLSAFTSSTTMTTQIRDPWPYRQPSVHVDGIDSWHATDGQPCLWQLDDNTKTWLTFDGILARIELWAQRAEAGFTGVDAAALDPHLYFPGIRGGVVGIDINGLIGNVRQEGQHGKLHLNWPNAGFATIGPRTNATGPDLVTGRWFFRGPAKIAAPPRDMDEFEACLTGTQKGLLAADLARDRRGVFVLAWPTSHGTSCLVLLISQDVTGQKVVVFSPTPVSQAERLLRAGPDAQHLASKRIVIFGCGAIGSHLTSLLARSGATEIVVVDGDSLIPAGAVRHAFGGIGVPKATEAVAALAPFDWATIEPVTETVWDLDTMATIVDGAAVCIDATGNNLFAELLSRVALAADVPFVTVALFRGGRICRVRRQSAGDPPLVGQPPNWRRPSIPAGPDPDADFLGAETGCVAAIHNAPPASVMCAASLGCLTVTDFLSGRANFPSEVIDVLEPIEPPFHQLGRFRPLPNPVLLTDAARSTMVTASARVSPKETGGVLVGVRDTNGTAYITDAVELPPDAYSSAAYRVPAGTTQAAVEALRAGDDRKQYVGEWHSHPTDQPASPTDVSTMLSLANHPDTGDPVLCVLRPVAGSFQVDAYVTEPPELVRVPVMAAGPLPPKGS